MYLLKFLLKYISKFNMMMSVRNLKNGHALARYVSFGGRLSHHYMTWRFIKRFCFLMIGSHVLLGVIVFVVLSTSLYIRGTVSTSMFSRLIDYVPFSYETVTSWLVLIWKISSAWSLFVGVNHYTDIVTLILQETTWTGYISAVWGYVYVVNFEMAKEFFTVLINRPLNITDTRAIMELVLFSDNVRAWLFMLTPMYWLNGDATGMWSYPILVIQQGAMDTISFITSSISASTWLIWEKMVTGIQSGITPMIPGPEIITSPLSRRLATAIAGYLTYHIIRGILWWWLG